MKADNVTRSTRQAANAAALAVIVFAVLWFATTQVRAIRDVSPFADDPWDAVASYAAIFLPLVAGATWIRSLRHRAPSLPAVTAARIRWGAGLAVGIVLVAVAADFVAIATAPSVGIAPGDVRFGVIVILVIAAGCAAVTAVALLVRAAALGRLASATGTVSPVDASPEPDVVEDLLALAGDVARPIGLGRSVGRLSGAVERFLDESGISPRRHRIIFGVVLALVAGVGFSAWHGVMEGGWASLFGGLVFGSLTALGVLGIYLATVVPLRLLRPPAPRPRPNFVYAEAPE